VVEYQGNGECGRGQQGCEAIIFIYPRRCLVTRLFVNLFRTFEKEKPRNKPADNDRQHCLFQTLERQKDGNQYWSTMIISLLLSKIQPKHDTRLAWTQLKLRRLVRYGIITKAIQSNNTRGRLSKRRLPSGDVGTRRSAVTARLPPVTMEQQ
jgi:hypothetical protein